MKNLNHPRLMLLANAGSGKTHALVSRCIWLLLNNCPPESILALTFTRMAAAEFLQKLFERLADAAERPEALEALRTQLHMPKLGRERCIELLRSLIQKLPALAMGTMDQFFARIVRNFPQELGLPQDFELLNEAALAEAQSAALDAMLTKALSSPATRGAFDELLRGASNEKASRAVRESLLESLSALHQRFLSLDSPPVAADLEKLRRSTSAGGPGSPASRPLKETAAEFFDEIQRTQTDLDPGLGEWLEKYASQIAQLPPGSRLGKDLKELVTYLDKGFISQKKPPVEVLKFGRKGKISKQGNLPELAAELFDALLDQEIRAVGIAGRAMLELLGEFEKAYAESIRQSGGVSFGDITHLLVAHPEAFRGELGYRLDARYDHWVLDEFQDTSRAQWAVLGPLADEILCDPSDSRTFFCVGDNKQSIYAWRGGDEGLFSDILQQYNRTPPPRILKEPLGVSWRSDRAIIDSINSIFSPEGLSRAADSIAGSGKNSTPALTETVIARWKQSWVEHSARENAAAGFVALIEAAPGATGNSKGTPTPSDDAAAAAEAEEIHAEEDSDADAKEDVVGAEVVKILHEVRPWSRGLSCAILTRTNQRATELARLLQSENIPVILEGRTPASQINPECIALLSVIRCVVYPTDSVAESLFRFSPWSLLLKGGEVDAFRAGSFGHSSEHGVAATVRMWIQSAAEAGVVQPHRLAPMLRALNKFEMRQKPLQGWRECLRELEHEQIEGSEMPGTVRILTIHKSKGLGMDMVILPELESPLNKFAAGELEFVRADGKTIALNLPSKDFCALDSSIDALRQSLVDAQTFEQLCCFYVAATRAKHALYLVADSTSKAANSPAALARKAFPNSGGNEQAGNSGADSHKALGDSNWYQRYPLQPSPTPTAVREGNFGMALRNRFANSPQSASARHKAPSTLTIPPWKPRTNFVEVEREKKWGRNVHALLARIEWKESDFSTEGFSPNVVEKVKKFLKTKPSEFLQKPAELVEVWRERAFMVLVDGRPLSGVFDRVHIHRDTAGQVVKVEIFDYKTEDAEDVKTRYKEQLAAYRTAASLLLRTDPALVSAIPVAV